MSINKKPSLGRGLSALLGESLPPVNDQAFGHVETLSVTQLKPGQYQPRSMFDDEKLASLIDSIREKGIIQPLVVRNVGGEAYEIIAGERRWRAAKTLNLASVPVIIRECDDTEALELAIIENVQRDDLNPLEEAEAYQKLMTQFGYTQEHVAKRIGKSRSYVANILRLNNLPGNIKGLILEGKMTAGHARALIGMENSEQLAQDIVNQNLNVRDVEDRVRAAKNTESRSSRGPRQAVAPQKDEDIISLEVQLIKLLKANVYITLKADKGAIEIHFNSLEQMDDIIQRLNKLQLVDDE